MASDDLEPSSPMDRAMGLARELREVADVIERNPEIADLDDWYDAAQRLAMDLDLLDGHIGTL